MCIENKRGRPRLSPELKYQRSSLLLPPYIKKWLKENVKNKNGFIVATLSDKIKTLGNVES